MTNHTPSNPQAEYQQRLQNRQSAVGELTARYRRIGYSRIGGIIAIIACVLAALDTGKVGWFWAIGPFFVYSLVQLGRHQAVHRELGKARRAVGYYEKSLRRIDGSWPGDGVAGTEYRRPGHPYADDLDLFGTGSLFERLCTCRTRSGETTLAAWLSVGATVEEIGRRQEAVAELRKRIELREDLAVIGQDIRSGLDVKAITAWGNAPVEPGLARLRILATLLAILNLIGLMFAVVTENLIPLYVFLLISSGAGILLRPRISKIIAGVDPACKDLELLSGILARIEAEEFSSRKLVELRKSLDVAGDAPSKRVRKLSRIKVWLDARLNQLFRPISAPFFWTTNFALAAEEWRRESGPAIGKWIAAVGEIEALCALAGYWYENPEDVFPEFVLKERALEVQGIGHPLIQKEKLVRTDLALNDQFRLLVVSGSNMSGKSTLLRALGVNVVLAMAGAPVCARRLILSPLQVGASIRIQDNLRSGESLFYAEILRLKLLVQLAAESPALLFLIDEILHGTNSHDRKIGAEAVITGLVRRGAIGLVTTHDLALTEMVERSEGAARNVHFQDQLSNGKMSFDYILRNGIVTKSNAIELMRSIGLEV